jgi:hypothetical protein
MAQKVQVQLIDDLDGSEAIETVNFGLDGTGYEIDLNGRNAGNLRASIAEYVGHARRASPVRAVGQRPRSSRVGSAVMRQWLVDNGYGEQLNDRGRIPGRLQEMYENRTPNARQAPAEVTPEAEANVPEMTPEDDAKVSEVIANAKDEVTRRRQNRAAARTVKPATVADPPATEQTEAPKLRRPAHRRQTKAKTDGEATT